METRHWLLLFALGTSGPLLAGAPPAAEAGFDSYVRTLESRLTEQHRSPDRFLARRVTWPTDGDIVIERVSGADLPGAMLNHWRGTAFAAGAKAADFERLLRDFASYPRIFSPQVLQASATTQQDKTQVWMRIQQHHVITVTMDAKYDVTFGRLDARRRYSISRSTAISEIDSGGDHGFLWRLNTYWTYDERDGGLYLQIETVSLSRSIPRGLGWMIRPWVERVPRESLEFTLRSARDGLLH